MQLREHYDGRGHSDKKPHFKQCRRRGPARPSARVPSCGRKCKNRTAKASTQMNEGLRKVGLGLASGNAARFRLSGGYRRPSRPVRFGQGKPRESSVGIHHDGFGVVFPSSLRYAVACREGIFDLISISEGPKPRYDVEFHRSNQNQPLGGRLVVRFFACAIFHPTRCAGKEPSLAVLAFAQK